MTDVSAKRYKINAGFITEKIGNKITVFSGEQSVLFTFNDSAAFIFQSLKLGWSNEKIAEGLVKKYDVAMSEAGKDVQEFAQVLLKKGIISLR